MEPQIQYVKSADGTRIGFWAFGRGRPLVVLPSHFIFSIHSLWEVPEVRANLERLSQKHLVIQYDSRGQGVSSRESTDFSRGALVADLDAVVTRLPASQVDLLAIGFAGMTAIVYAALSPDKVRRLVLASAWANGRDFRPNPEMRAIAPLIDVNWDLYLRTLALVWFGWTETGRIIAEMTSRDASRETMLAGIAEMRRTDVTSLLPDVQCPTLLVHAQNVDAMSADGMRDLAAAMPRARLVTYETDVRLIMSGQRLAGLVEEFLDESDEAQLPSFHGEAVERASGTAVIFFADIVDSTVLTERLGDAAFRERARTLDTALRTIIRDGGGTPIEGKLLGDGVLATFTSASQAIGAAMACGKAGEDGGLPLHLGLHAGDVIREDNNVFGGAVNVAARISGLSAAGEVLVSDTVRSLARTSAGVSFEDRGEKALKGVGEPVRVWAVAKADTQETSADLIIE